MVLLPPPTVLAELVAIVNKLPQMCSYAKVRKTKGIIILSFQMLCLLPQCVFTPDLKKINKPQFTHPLSFAVIMHRYEGDSSCTSDLFIV